MCVCVCVCVSFYYIVYLNYDSVKLTNGQVYYPVLRAKKKQMSVQSTWRASWDTGEINS